MTYIPTTPNGIALVATSNPVVTPMRTITGTAKSAPAVNYEFLTDSASGWFDALGFSWASFTVVPTAAAANGVLSFECTNDPSSAPNGVAWIVQDSTSKSVSRATNVTLTATVRQFETPITTRYVRIRVSTTVPGGTVAVSATFRQEAPPMSTQLVTAASTFLTAGSSNGIGTAIINTASNQFGNAQTAASRVFDFSSVVMTTTTTSAAVSLAGLAANQPPSANFSLTVTAASGTNPTLDVVVQESYDGTTYHDLYHFDRITAIGRYFSPLIQLNGYFIRYVRNIGGTSPSLTGSFVRHGVSFRGEIYRRYYDRTINPNSVASSTASYITHGCIQMRMLASSGTATSVAIITLQGSDDNSNWWDITTLTTVASSVTLVEVPTFVGKWVRGIVSTAGSGQTINYIQFTGIGPS